MNNMNEVAVSSPLDDIIIYKESKGVVYGYYNQKALDLALFNRAKERTNGFSSKTQFDNEAVKRAVLLEDLPKQEHCVMFRTFSDGEYVSAGSAIFDLGIDSVTFSNYCNRNNISQMDTWLYCGIKVFSNYSGYFFNKIPSNTYVGLGGPVINDEDLLFAIELAEEPHKGDEEIKIVRFSYNLLEKKYVQGLPYLSNLYADWLVKDCSNVQSGDDVLIISDKYGSQVIKTPFSGIIVQHPLSSLHNGLPLFNLYPNETSLIKNLFKYKFVVKKDEFTQKCIVICEFERQFISHDTISTCYSRFGMDMSIIRGTDLFFNFEFEEGKHYLLFFYMKKRIKLDKNCSLLLLLDNGRVLSLHLATKPIKDSEIMNLCRFQLSNADMDELESAKFSQWRIIDGDGEPLMSGINACCYNIMRGRDDSREISRNAFQDCFIAFRKTVIENVPKEELEDNSRADSKQSCYVYLMIDTTNNFHKIGISNNPSYREHTLQSDKPTIELICAKEFPSRALAEAFEASLHRVYASKRIRGEWFNLDEFDIDEIKQVLNN